jgi:hypothetical protein
MVRRNNCMRAVLCETHYFLTATTLTRGMYLKLAAAQEIGYRKILLICH